MFTRLTHPHLPLYHSLLALSILHRTHIKAFPVMEYVALLLYQAHQLDLDDL